jgi:hypothetical protein
MDLFFSSNLKSFLISTHLNQSICTILLVFLFPFCIFKLTAIVPGFPINDVELQLSVVKKPDETILLPIPSHLFNKTKTNAVIP